MVVCFTVFLMFQYTSQDIEHLDTLQTDNTLPRLQPFKTEASQVSVMDSCMEIKLDNNNKADIQISSLVEELDFHLDHGGHNQTSFPDLQPLPNSQNLRVFLIPHSHCDPGWLETYTKYYENKVRYILSWLYIFAMEHSDFKFIYAEVSFFKLWWEEQDVDVKLDMRRLAQEGRFEFVQGGWVQNDEANTHYFAIFNQMLDGHDWLKKNIPEAMPKSGWAIDPFGLSPTMGYVNKLFGLTGMHIQRVHYAVKNHLAQTKNLDFRWRQSWDSEGVTDMLTHLGPFVSYGQQHSCGPDPDVCCMFNFMDMRNGGFRECFKSGSLLVPTTEENVVERSLKILEQWRLKAALHSTNAVFIELGNDFTYSLKEDAHLMYDNYKPIMNYINSQPDLNSKVSWGVLSEYFEHVREHGTQKLAALSGDFFTYSDRQADYWSGYYTSRPFYKNLDRVLESALRRTEILFSFYRSDLRKGAFVMARNTLSLFQHHDGITGTAKTHVVNDYGAR
ncbi:alpha-mannosidase 2x-like [Bolinopsis microptera]|uniref:alpha-mannosidase 2x-like n=1 Tax=Bolinopsis microptera TaxID=2820187 RepID=UPI00307A3A87